MPTHDIDDEGNCWQDLLHCSFCGAEPPEASELVIGPGVSICGRCAQLAVDVCTYKDALPAPDPVTMRAMAGFMRRAASAALESQLSCPWCHSSDVRLVHVVSLKLDKVIMTNSCGNCGAWEVEAGEDISTLTPSEMEKGWHQSPRREFSGAG